MPKYTDVMVDLETTGVTPDESAIIQIAAVRFNVITGEVDGDDMFDRALMIPPKRFWDEGTRDWWYKMPDILMSIMNRMEDPVVVTRDFFNWARPKDDDRTLLRFWSKPTHFDFMFLQSYSRQFQLNFPFDFRQAQDQNSFVRGLFFPNPPPELSLNFEGSAHNALFDVLHQIQTVQEYVKKATGT